MIRIAVCDNEKAVVNQIETMIFEIFGSKNTIVELDTFLNGNELEKSISQGDCFDIIYLNTLIEDENGITTAKNIREKNSNVLIIFISEDEDSVWDAFQLIAYNFLRKPLDENVFAKVLLEAIEYISNQDIYYNFKFKGTAYRFPYCDIMYFESNGRKIYLHFRNDEKIFYNGKLSDIEKKLLLGKTPFLRIHQSYLVNFHFIRAKNRTEIALINGKTLPISLERQKEFPSKYMKLLKG
ncbi:MAG: LytTR family DNA-binding domain-containing protein [Lachnospiraceae bacterium]|nr:LytTR family DNA-binding domain-containing protein [Lachnospiraceae bacterium]